MVVKTAVITITAKANRILLLPLPMFGYGKDRGKIGNWERCDQVVCKRVKVRPVLGFKIRWPYGREGSSPSSGI